MRNHLKAKKNRHFCRSVLVPRGGIEPGLNDWAWRSVDGILPELAFANSGRSLLRFLSLLQNLQHVRKIQSRLCKVQCLVRRSSLCPFNEGFDCVFNFCFHWVLFPISADI